MSSSTNSNQGHNSASSGLHITIEHSAWCSAIKEHRNLYSQMVEREKEVEIEAQQRHRRRHPFHSFWMERVEDSKSLSRSLRWCVKMKARRFQELMDRKRGLNQASSLEHRVQSTGLYAAALTNPSTDLLRSQRSSDRNSAASKRSSLREPKSVEVIQVVSHESQQPLRRARATSAFSGSMIAASMASWTWEKAQQKPSTSSNPAGNSKDVYSSGHSPATSTFPSQDADRSRSEPSISHPPPTKGCMRKPKTHNKASTSASSQPSATTSPSSSSSPSAQRLSSASTCSVAAPSCVEASTDQMALLRIHTTRVVYVSYADGNDEVEEPTIEGWDGEKRPSRVVCRWGEGIDEIIP